MSGFWQRRSWVLKATGWCSEDSGDVFYGGL